MGELVRMHDRVTDDDSEVTRYPCATERCGNVAKHHLGPMRDDALGGCLVLHLCRECKATVEKHYTR